MNKRRCRYPKNLDTALVEDALVELSDPSFQRRVWVDGDPTEVSSFNEAIAALFDDSGLAKALEVDDITFSERIDRDLQELVEKATALQEKHAQSSPQELFEDHEMEAIRLLATEIRGALKNVVQ